VKYREFWVNGIQVKESEKALSCECGGTKTQTPHSSWCPLY
jgi:hypothetical protein